MPAPSTSHPLAGKRVLVTGGGGFIGSHLVDGLLAVGASVVVLDNFATGHRENLAHCLDRIELRVGDIRDLPTCLAACEGASAVLHQAALGSVPRSMEDPATTIAVNVAGTANVFAAARDAGVERVVYASSSSVYGDDDALPKREGRVGHPLSPYAVSKVMNEQLAQIYARCYGMAFVGLRYFNVYGPRQDPRGAYAAVVPRFFAACAAGEDLTIYGDGEQSRDFTFVTDVVEANLLAATRPVEGAFAVNVGAGSTTTVAELARAIIGITGARGQARHEEARAGDPRFSRADASLARGALGWLPQVQLAEGLQRIADAG